jgi:hypothetical protein
MQIKILHLQSLDEVHIDVETCEDLRSMSSPQGISSYTGPAKYSFIHKVIDGITVAVNTVLVTFKSPAFIASVQVSIMLSLYNITAYIINTVAQSSTLNSVRLLTFIQSFYYLDESDYGRIQVSNMAAL